MLVGVLLNEIVPLPEIEVNPSTIRVVNRVHFRHNIQIFLALGGFYAPFTELYISKTP